MNPVRALLFGSLAANAALAAFMLLRPGSGMPPRGIAVETAGPTAVAADSETTTQLVSAPTPAPAISISAWQQLRGESDADFVARLRAGGFPSDMIRAIVRTEVTGRYAARRREIEALRDAQPWWSGGPIGPGNLEVRRAERALQREMERAIAEVLGASSWLYLPEDVARATRRYGELPIEKITRLQEIERDYGELSAEINTEAQGIFLPEDRERLALLEEEKRRDFAALLTPEELAEFDRRGSPTAERLRNQLRSFEPTEAEYLALYDVWKEFDDRTKPPGPRTRETAAQQREAERGLEPQIAATLGPTRFEDYKLASHPAMNQVRAVTDRFGLPREKALAAVKLQTEFSLRADAIRATGTLVDDQLGAVAREATSQLESLLGPEAFAEYRRGPGGWLSRLQAPPPR